MNNNNKNKNVQRIDLNKQQMNYDNLIMNYLVPKKGDCETKQQKKSRPKKLKN